MALFDRLRAAFFTPLTAPELDVNESTGEGSSAPPVDAPYAARDIDPNNLRGGLGNRYGSYLQSASALINSFTGQGTKRDPSTFNWWGVPRTLNRIERIGMGRNALVQQALGKLPNAATREGWHVEILDDTVEDKQGVSEEISAYEQRLAITNRINRALFRGRQYSQALVILGIDDGRPFNEPVVVDNIKTIRWSVVVDSRDFQPYKLADSGSQHFGGVELFEITAINGVLEDGLRYGCNSVNFDYNTWQKTIEAEHAQQSESGRMLVHADRVLYFPTGDYYSVLDSLQDSLGAYFETMGGIRTAARESSMLKYKVTNNQRQQWNANADLAKQHMGIIHMAKSAINAFVVGANDDVEMLSRSLAGVADLANPVMAWVAAALSIPNTIFWQVSPGGFGKGEAERETFHEDVHAFQDQILTPQLTRLHGYILVALDGPRLSPNTRRKIAYNDLSPPDEELLSKLRNEALERLEIQAEKGLISRAEFRAAASKLNDAFYQLELDEEAVEKPQPAQVGIFTGSIAIMQALYGEDIPVTAVRELLVALNPVHFNADNIPRIIPEKEQPASATPNPADPTTTGGDPSDPSAVPGDEEDGEHEPTEVDIAWEQVERPADADTAKTLAEVDELKRDQVKSHHIKRLASQGKIRAYPPRGYSSEPTFSLQEVKRALLEKHGHLTPEQRAEIEAAADALAQSKATDYGAQSVCVMLRLPKKLARFVPFVEEHPGPLHVTLVYCKHVEQRQLDSLLARLREVTSTFDPFEVKVHGDPIHYFDTPEGRCAHVQAAFNEQDLVFDELADVFEELGLQVSRFEGGYKPHVTLGYMDGDENYFGPRPAGSWEATQASVTYGGEPVAVLDFEGKDLPFGDDEGEPWDVEEGVDGKTRDRAPLIKEGWIWRTQKDDRVRPDHRKLEGRRFRPGQKHPKHGEPGDEPNCRCAKEVIVPPKGTKRARAAAKRTTKRALKQRYEKVTGAALKRAAKAVDVDDYDTEDECFGDLYWSCLRFVEAEDAKVRDDMSEEKRREYIDKAFKRYHEETNMGASELERWSKTEWSKEASLSREPITRNLRLLRKKKSEWTLEDARGAMKTVNFNSRMRGNARGKPVKIDGREGPSKRDISLKNWAWDPSK